jgi:hypothetical protein
LSCISHSVSFISPTISITARHLQHLAAGWEEEEEGRGERGREEEEEEEGASTFPPD